MNYTLYQVLFRPKATNPDVQRREMLLNILLSGLAMIALLAFTITLIHHLAGGVHHNTSSLLATGIFFLIILGLCALSRRGHIATAAYIFIIFLTLAATDFLLTWGFGLTAAELLYALVIVIAGVLLTARAALLVSGLITVLVLGLAYAQVHGIMHPDTDWMRQKLGFGDAIGYVAVFCIIGLVTWLANREIDRSLQRARTSEAALARERDQLEVKVLERTQQLEQAQLERTMELQRFAEFGRLNANLLHEVANPLTVASLNLEQLQTSQQPEIIAEVRRSLQNLERYIEATRKQLRKQDSLSDFSVEEELNQVLGILNALAQKSSVQLRVTYKNKVRLYGDAVKFNQLSANVIMNAVEAYHTASGSTGKNRTVDITVSANKTQVIIAVQDFGQGIPARHIDHLFEPFYTTKTHTSSRHGLGIGLAMVKQYVNDDFHGNITVSSQPVTGTCFTITLKRHKQT